MDASSTEALVKMPRCDHRAHMGCMNRWVGSCPMCRSAVEYLAFSQLNAREHPFSIDESAFISGFMGKARGVFAGGDLQIARKVADSCARCFRESAAWIL